MSARARSLDRAFGDIEWEEHDPDWGCCPSQAQPVFEDDPYAGVPLPLDHELRRREPLTENPFGLWPHARAFDDILYSAGGIQRYGLGGLLEPPEFAIC